MARVSIDDELHADHRFKRLVRKMGDEDKAVGLLYRFWRIAQDYWGDEMALIPTEVFEAEDFQILHEVGLAEKEAGGFYASGSEEKFKWYLQRCRASKAGVEVRRRKLGVEQPESDFRSTESSAPVNPSLRTAPYRSVPLRSDIAPIEESSSAGAETCRPDLLSVWNENCGTLPKAEKLNAERCRAWKRRWSDHPDTDYWISVVKRLAASPFCQGNNERGWEANIDFLLRPNTHLKAIEGQYDGKVGARRMTHAELVSQANRELYQKIDAEERANEASTGD